MMGSNYGRIDHEGYKDYSQKNLKRAHIKRCQPIESQQNVSDDIRYWHVVTDRMDRTRQAPPDISVRSRHMTADFLSRCYAM